jgi:radical SAM protein with 4Fe4S-binding SPASM domain
MNKSIERWMTKYVNLINFFVQVSVDGKQDMHDYYRKTVTGKPSFHLIEKNIPRFKKIMKGHEGALSVHGVINKMHLPNLYENYKFFKESWGMDNIWFMPLHEESWEDEDVENYISELNKIKDYIVKDDDFKGSLNDLRSYSPLKNCFRNIASSAPCSAGKTYGSISTTGEIHPCHHIYFNNGDEMKIGDIFNGIDDAKRRLFLDYGSSDLTCDKDCKAVTCYRCVAANMEKNGSPLNQIRDLYCTMSKKEAEVLQDLRVLLHENDYFGKLYFYDKVKDKDVYFTKRWQDKGEYYESYSTIGKPGNDYIYKAPLSEIPGTMEYKLNESQKMNEKLLEEVIFLLEQNKKESKKEKDDKVTEI